VILLSLLLLAQQVAIDNGTVAGPAVLSDNSKILVECEVPDKRDEPPTKCAFVNGATADEVMKVVWSENQARIRIAKDYEQHLRKDLALTKKMEQILRDIDKAKSEVRP
jgi:hypothetical protein